MDYLWWEKTVEYAFVLQSGCDFATPLAGAAERAGDAIFAAGTKLMLVEFKVDDDALNSEKRKYANYEEAEAALRGRDNHHLLVYGVRVVEANGRVEFVLGAKKYFERTEVLNMFAFDANGVDRPTFDEYLDDLLAHKKPDGRSSSGGPAHEAMVVGVSTSKQVVSASVREYWEESQKLQNKPQNTQTLSSGYGMGGPH